MSRCFPYPPPGYTLSGANNEALIESIKLQEKRVKPKDKEQRKKEKKEKKEKKKEKKKIKKEKAQQNLHKSDSVLGNVVEKSCTDTKSVLQKGCKAELEDTKSELLKGCKAELEHIERSILTEEHGHPVCLNVPSCSSDSTENSNKRKRQCSPGDVNRAPGKIIRIKLSKKPDESSVPGNEQRLCSTSGRVAQLPPENKDDIGLAQLPPQNKDGIGLAHRGQGLCSTSNGPGKVGQAFDSGKAYPTSQQIKTVAPVKTEIPPLKSTVMTPMQKLELHYNNLFENLAPPPLQGASLPDDDLDWLFHSKSSKFTEKKQISGAACMSCSGSQTSWPRAQYLQDVEVYALPYTVPF